MSRCQRCDSVGYFRGDNCVAIWVGNSRLPNLLHDCLQEARLKIYIRVLLIYPGGGA